MSDIQNNESLGNDFDGVSALQKPEPYCVVKRTLIGPSAGVMTCTTFKDKQAFDQWYAQTTDDDDLAEQMPLSEVYGIVAEGISEEQVMALIKSPTNDTAILRSLYGQLHETISEAGDVLDAMLD